MDAFRNDLFAGRVALVTGGATGLGREIARQFGLHGAAVAICSRTEANLRAACDALAAAGIDAMYAVCDIRRPDEVTAAVAAVLDRYGRLDVLVNNAAGNFLVPISRLSYNAFRTVVEIDLIGTYNVSKAAFEAWLKDHGGIVVNITAAIPSSGMPLQAHMMSAKAGIDALTRACSAEWGARGIRVNAVAPGGMASTEGLQRIMGAADGPAPVALRRYGSTTEVANAVLFLASDAAAYITGASIAVDGGGMLDSSLPSVEAFERAFATVRS